MSKRSIVARNANTPNRLRKLEAELNRRDREARRRRVAGKRMYRRQITAGNTLWNLLQFIAFAVVFGVAVILALNLLFWAAGIAFIVGLAWVIYHLLFGKS